MKSDYRVTIIWDNGLSMHYGYVGNMSELIEDAKRVILKEHINHNIGTFIVTVYNVRTKEIMLLPLGKIQESLGVLGLVAEVKERS